MYAATNNTAAEILHLRAGAEKMDMGLTSYKGSRVRKSDVRIAKNYLNPEEIDTLNRITVMFLDMADFRSRRRSNIRMTDWDVALMKFLSDNELPILEGYGTISHEAGTRHAEESTSTPSFFYRPRGSILRGINFFYRLPKKRLPPSPIEIES